MSAAPRKAFLDTSIFVYSFDSSAPAKREKAQALIADGLEHRRAVISYQVVQEFLSVATRKFAPPLSSAQARTYLTSVLLPLCEVFPNASLFSQALSVSAEVRISFYDALIVSCALSAGCTLLLTEDLQNKHEIGALRIQNPFH